MANTRGVRGGVVYFAIDAQQYYNSVGKGC